MNKKESEILKKMLERNDGLFSPATLINSLSSGDRRSVESLVSQGYIQTVFEIKEGHTGGSYSLISYSLTEKGLVYGKSVFHRLAYTFTKNITLILAIFSIVSAAFSSVAAYYAIDNAFQARWIANLDPRVTLDVDLNLKRNELNEIPPHFKIKNWGPIKAEQVEVRFTAFEYNKATKEVEFSMHSSGDEDGQNFLIGDLDALKYKFFKVDNKLLSLYLEKKVPDTESIIETQVSYRRESDKKSYSSFVYSFVGSDGEWVSLNEESLDLNSSTHFKELNEAVQLFKEEHSF